MNIDYEQWAYCENEGLKNLKILDSKFELKKWHFEITENEEAFTDRAFWHILPSKYHESEKVPLKNIVGTSHPDYHGKMWLAVLGCLKRFDNYTWSKNTFMEKNKSLTLSYSKYGDKYFIGQGNHRTTIGKFFEIDYLEAPVTEYFFDKEFFDLYTTVKKLDLFPELNYYGRDSTWMITLNSQRFYLTNFTTVVSFVHYFKSVKITYKSLLKNKIIAHFTRNKEIYHLRNKDDFNLVYYEIIKHKLRKLNL